MHHNTSAHTIMAPRHFLDLPAELRIRCYKLVINELEAHVYRTGLGLWSYTYGRERSLLQACRQMRRDVLPLAAELPVNMHCSTNYAAIALPVGYASKVTSITISLDQLRTSTNGFDLVHLFPKLKHAVVKTDPDRLPADDSIAVFDTVSSEQINEMVRCRAQRTIAYLRRTLSYGGLVGISLRLERRFKIRIFPRAGPSEVRRQNWLVRRLVFRHHPY